MKAKPLALIALLGLVGAAAYAVDVDGQLAQGEYSREASFDKGNYRLLWRIVDDKLFMAIDAKAGGWVAIGFEQLQHAVHGETQRRRERDARNGRL